MDVCPICLFDVKIDRYITPCGHIFHDYCLRGVRTFNCPLCRAAIEPFKYTFVLINVGVCKTFKSLSPILPGFYIKKIVLPRLFPMSIRQFVAYKTRDPIAHDVTSYFIASTWEHPSEGLGWIREMPHQKFEQMRQGTSQTYAELVGIYSGSSVPLTNCTYDLRTCDEIAVRFPEYIYMMYGHRLDKNEDHRMRAWIIQKKNGGLLIQLEKAVCLRIHCWYGPTIASRFYFLAEDGKVFTPDNGSGAFDEMMLDVRHFRCYPPLVDGTSGAYYYPNLHHYRDEETGEYVIEKTGGMDVEALRRYAEFAKRLGRTSNMK